MSNITSLSGAPPPDRSAFREWCGEFAKPSFLLAMLVALGGVIITAGGWFSNQAQMAQRVAVLEKRVDDEVAHFDTFQTQIVQLGNQLSAVSARMDGMLELMRTVKDTQQSQNADMSRRMDVVGQQVQQISQRR